MIPSLTQFGRQVARSPWTLPVATSALLAQKVLRDGDGVDFLAGGGVSAALIGVIELVTGKARSRYMVLSVVVNVGYLWSFREDLDYSVAGECGCLSISIGVSVIGRLLRGDWAGWNRNAEVGAALRIWFTTRKDEASKS